MREFSVVLHSFEEVQTFVSLAMVQPFPVLAGGEQHRVNGKNFMGMLTLDYSQPVPVRVECGEEEYQRFLHELDPFRIA